MTVEELIDELARFSESVSELAGELSDAITSEIVSYLVENLEVSDGYLTPDPGNFAVLTGVVGRIEASVPFHNYTAILDSAIEALVEVAVLFRSSHADAMLENGIDFNEFSDEEVAAIESHIEASLQIIAEFPRYGLTNIRRFLSKAGHGTVLSWLIQGLSDGIRKTFKVEQIVFDQLIVLHRIFGSILGGRVESLGRTPLFQFVGPVARRAVCKELLGKILTRREISAIDNGHGIDAFHGCGGHGCKHSWSFVGVAA